MRYNALGDTFSVDFYHDLVSCISDRCGNMENERIVSAIRSVAELIEMLVYIPPTGEGTASCRDLVNGAADSLMKALRSDDESSLQSAHLAKVSELAQNALPFLKTASRQAAVILGGFEQSMQQRANVLMEITRAHFSILPKLFHFIHSTTPRLIKNQLLVLEGQTAAQLALQHEPFVHAVSITSMKILERSGPSSSWLPLAKILTNCNSGHVSAGDFILSDDAEKMGETVLKTAYAFRVNYGVDILREYPNLLPGYSESKLQSTRRIISMFMDFGLAEWESIWAQFPASPAGFARYLDAASEERLGDAVTFLSDYSRRVQVRRTQNDYNEVPLISPGIFLREYLGKWTSKEFTTEPSPHSLLLVKGLELLNADFLALRDFPKKLIHGRVTHFEIAPFLGPFNEYLDLCWEISEIYRSQGPYLEYNYAELMEKVRQVPAALFHADSQSLADAEHRKFLVQAGQALVQVLKQIITDNTYYSGYNILYILGKLLDQVRSIAIRQTVHPVVDEHEHHFISLGKYTEGLRRVAAEVAALASN